MILKNNHFIWKIDPPSHRCRGTWIIRVLASKCPEIGMLPWFFIPIVEFIIQLLSKFTRISHFCTKKFQQGDIGWYICHLLLMWIFIWICPVLMSFVLVKFSRGVYRPLWPPSPMSIRQPMLGRDRVINSAVFITYLIPCWTADESALCSGNGDTEESELCCRYSLPVRTSLWLIRIKLLMATTTFKDDVHIEFKLVSNERSFNVFNAKSYQFWKKHW